MSLSPSFLQETGVENLMSGAGEEERTTTKSKIQHLLRHYRVLEFGCTLVMLLIGGIFSWIDVHEREIPNIEVQLNATTTFWARDPTINLKKMPQQVPMWSLTIFGGIAPVLINLFINYMLPLVKHVRSIKHDTRDFLLSFMLSVSMALLLTQFMKNMTGRFRPCFHDMCGWQYDVVWDGVTNLCTDASWEKEGRKSFPSGHSSFAWSTMLLLTLYLLGRSRLNSENRSESMMRGVRRAFKLFICFIPCLVATWVAVTRSVDNWHHYTDIVTGSIIGAVSASLAYNYNYGSVFSWESAGVPNQEYHNRRKQRMRDFLDEASYHSSHISSKSRQHVLDSAGKSVLKSSNTDLEYGIEVSTRSSHTSNRSGQI